MRLEANQQSFCWMTYMKSTSNVFILMGVSGSGKTTLGKALAKATDGEFFDGDDFHSDSNRNKMASGIALTDEDRSDWLESIAQLVATRKYISAPTFIACSALKESYREVIRTADPSLAFLFLFAEPTILHKRMIVRHKSGEHFMPPSLLESQLTSLEVPEDAMKLDTTKSIEELVRLVSYTFPCLGSSLYQRDDDE